MERGTPDVIGMCMGMGFVWEAKKEGGEEPSDIQYIQLKKWKKAGAIIIPYTADAYEAVDIIRKTCYG